MSRLKIGLLLFLSAGSAQAESLLSGALISGGAIFILALLASVVHSVRSKNQPEKKWSSSVMLTVWGLVALGFIVSIFDGSLPALKDETATPLIQQPPVVTQAKPTPPPSNSAPIPQASAESERLSQPYGNPPAQPGNPLAQNYSPPSPANLPLSSPEQRYDNLVAAMERSAQYSGDNPVTRCEKKIPRKELPDRAAWVQLLRDNNDDEQMALPQLIKLQCGNSY